MHGRRSWSHVTVPSAAEYLLADPETDIILVGIPDAIEAELKAIGVSLSTRLRIHAASEVVSMDEVPAFALRYKKIRRCEWRSIWSKMVKL